MTTKDRQNAASQRRAVYSHAGDVRALSEALDGATAREDWNSVKEIVGQLAFIADEMNRTASNMGN